MLIQKILSSLGTLLLLTAVCHADPQSDAIRKVAEANAAAVQKSDFNTVVKYSYPKVVEILGGKEKMIEKLNEPMTAMKERGFKIISITVETPGPIRTEGDKMYSIVPTTTLAHTTDDKVTQKSFYLAVSSDKGTTWYLLDGAAVDTYNITAIIPDFPQDFKLPFKEPSRMEPLMTSEPATP